MTPWHDRSPIYRQLADRLTSSLLDGDPPEGDAMPSVRVLAQRFLINPITVGRALQALSDDGLLEMRRGLGLYVRPGARQHLLTLERQRFLDNEWPQLRQRLRRLGLRAEQLEWEA